MPNSPFQAEPLDAMINVRVTSEEKESVKEAAEMAGLTVSAYARRRVLGRTVLANTDEVMIRELRRLGGLAKAIYLGTGKEHGDKTGAILLAIQEAITRLARGPR
jgi:hypothetical protein